MLLRWPSSILHYKLVHQNLDQLDLYSFGLGHRVVDSAQTTGLDLTTLHIEELMIRIELVRRILEVEDVHSHHHVSRVKILFVVHIRMVVCSS